MEQKVRWAGFTEVCLGVARRFCTVLYKLHEDAEK